MPNTKKSAAGSGNIRKKTVIRGGKEYTYWEGRISTGLDPKTGKQKQRSVSGKTQKEVAQKLRQLTAEVDQGTYQEPSKVTVGDWLDTWADQCLGNVKPMTVKNYREHIANHIKPELGIIRISNLTTTDIQKFYNSLGQSQGDKPGLAPKTIKCIHGILHKALQQAIAVGYLRTNPTEACSLPRVERKEIHPLDNEDIQKFLQAIRGHRYEAPYITALFTGLRRGELCGLTWDCVDLNSGKIVVKKQLQNIPGEPGAYRFVSLKNDKSRSITIADSLVEVLRRHKDSQDILMRNAGELWQDTGFVFTNEVGDHLSPSTVYHQFKKIAASIDLPDARLHDLRHTFGSSLVNGICQPDGTLMALSPRQVADLLGHSTSQITEMYYVKKDTTRLQGITDEFNF